LLILFFNSLYVPGHTQISTNTDTIYALALPQPVSGCTSKLHISIAYVVYAFAFPQYVSGCTSKLHISIAYVVSAFDFPQHVSDCACTLQIHLLMLFMPLPSHSM